MKDNETLETGQQEKQPGEQHKTDRKQQEEDTEFVKEEQESTRKYIFQKSKITKVAFVIVIAFLILLILGLVISGTSFFESSL